MRVAHVYVHHPKVVIDDSDPHNNGSVGHKGHPLVCFLEGSCCQSRLRILRSASVHYAVLRHFLRLLYGAIRCHRTVCMIDEALVSGDFTGLMSVSKCKDFESVFCLIEAPLIREVAQNGMHMY